MIFNEAWFVHALNAEVDLLAQQLEQATRGSYRLKDGVIGKTWPFNMIGPARMSPITRDSDTTYVNPGQTKRRAQLVDRGVAALIDDFDRIKTVADIDPAITETLAAAKNREKDVICISAALGNAVTVDEAGEVTGVQALPGSQTIAHGSVGLTVAKVLDVNERFNKANVPQQDRYMFYSAEAMTDLLQNTQVTDSNFNTIKALAEGGFPQDQKWCNLFWRMVTGFIDEAQTIPILPKTGNIRTCVAWQKRGVGVAMGLDKSIETGPAPHKWNNQQMVLKLSMGAVRIQDAYVVAVEIDESV
jgi:hypothetical protein